MEEQEQKKEFTGVWIPRHIVEDQDLSMTDKMIYSEIACFNICFKSNEKLGERYNLKAGTVSRVISKLKGKGYIEEVGFDGRYRKLSAKRDKPKPNRRQTTKKIVGRLREKSHADYEKNRTIDNSKDNKKENKKLYIGGFGSAKKNSSSEIKKEDSEKEKYKPFFYKVHGYSYDKKKGIKEVPFSERTKTPYTEEEETNYLKNSILTHFGDISSSVETLAENEVQLKAMLTLYKSKGKGHSGILYITQKIEELQVLHKIGIVKSGKADKFTTPLRLLYGWREISQFYDDITATEEYQEYIEEHGEFESSFMERINNGEKVQKEIETNDYLIIVGGLD